MRKLKKKMISIMKFATGGKFHNLYKRSKCNK